MAQRDRRDKEAFRVRPGAPKARSPRFVQRVLREMGQLGAGTTPPSRAPVGAKPGARPGARLGRGHTAARIGASLAPDARRVAIKVRLVRLKLASAESTAKHLRYLERDSVARDGNDARAYGSTTDNADVSAFEQRGRGDRHQFRFIIAPEDASQLEDLHGFTRTLMTRVEADLGTTLDWVAVDHWDTDNPHTHLLLRGKADNGRDLVIAGEYISRGMRERASALATEWLGPRTEWEIRQSVQREVAQDRFTQLDRVLMRQMQGGTLRFDRSVGDGNDRGDGMTPTLLLRRLHYLKGIGLAQEAPAGTWALRDDIEPVLRAMSERADIVRTMQRTFSQGHGGDGRDFATFDAQREGAPVTGRVTGKGLADELQEHGYLVVDGIDGRAHYVPLGTQDLAQFPVGALVAAHGARERPVDTTIVGLARDGVYRTHVHREQLMRDAPDGDADDVVARHVRRLEALRRAGHVQRVADGVWQVPADLVQRGRRYDARQVGHARVELLTRLPLERQVRVIGATWLDQQLLGKDDIAARGFGEDVRRAVHERGEFLVEQGFAQRRAGRLILMRDLLATLRNRELESAARQLAGETASRFHPTEEGKRVSGIYRRSITLASGRFALLDDGRQFSLVPWKPVIEPRLGHTLSAIVRGGHTSWDLGRSRTIGFEP